MGFLGRLLGSSHGEPADVFTHLRAQALNIQPGELGVYAEDSAPIFGVLMETGFRNGSATLACMADGAVSIYTSTGGGTIGAGEHEAVRTVCLQVLAWTNQYADDFIRACRPAKEYPLPRNGEVLFYLLTTRGVYVARCTENKLVKDEDPFSNLFKSCHTVLTAAREATEGGKERA